MVCYFSLLLNEMKKKREEVLMNYFYPFSLIYLVKLSLLVTNLNNFKKGGKLVRKSYKEKEEINNLYTS